MNLLKKISLIAMIIGYLLAGVNHFRAPESYYRIIPPYMPWPKLLNILAGFFEILFGLLLIYKYTRPMAARGIILLLILFIPVHVDMVIRAPFQLGSLYVTPLIAWVRLVVLQPVLIWLGWQYTRSE